MSEYETVCILNPEVSGSAFEKIRDKIVKVITDHRAQVLNQKDWGKRKMSYRIGRHNSGHYLYFNYAGEGSFIPELERTLKYDESVVRFLTVRLGDKAKKVLLPEEFKLGFEEGGRSHEGVRKGPYFENQGGFDAEEN